MEAAFPEYHGVPDGDSTNQQFGRTLFPIKLMASKFSDHGRLVMTPHKVVKETGPPQILLSEMLQTDLTHA